MKACAAYQPTSPGFRRRLVPSDPYIPSKELATHKYAIPVEAGPHIEVEALLPCGKFQIFAAIPAIDQHLASCQLAGIPDPILVTIYQVLKRTLVDISLDPKFQ